MTNKKAGKNYYDVAYKTKNGRMMVATRVEAKTAQAAMQKVKKEMEKSNSFEKVITAIKL